MTTNSFASSSKRFCTNAPTIMAVMPQITTMRVIMVISHYHHHRCHGCLAGMLMKK